MSDRWKVTKAELIERRPDYTHKFRPDADPREHVIVLEYEDPESRYGAYRGRPEILGITLRDWRGEWSFAPAGGHVQPSHYASRDEALTALIACRRGVLGRAVEHYQKAQADLEEALTAIGR